MYMIAQTGATQARDRHGTRSITLSGMRAASPVTTSAPAAAVMTKPYQYIAGEPPPSGGALPNCHIP
jgi:hypothetical protein